MEETLEEPDFYVQQQVTLYQGQGSRNPKEMRQMEGGSLMGTQGFVGAGESPLRKFK